MATGCYGKFCTKATQLYDNYSDRDKFHTYITTEVIEVKADNLADLSKVNVATDDQQHRRIPSAAVVHGKLLVQYVPYKTISNLLLLTTKQVDWSNVGKQ